MYLYKTSLHSLPANELRGSYLENNSNLESFSMQRKNEHIFPPLQNMVTPKHGVLYHL